MNKEEYLDIIKEKTNLSKKDIDAVICEYLELLKVKIKENKKASITNFGTFTLKVTKPFEYFSPVDGRKIKTTGIKKIFFSASKDLLKKI